MGWFKKEKKSPIGKWSFFVVDDKRKGYRINDQCQPLWETPKGVPKYFVGTREEAVAKSREIFEKWKEVFGVYPAELKAQEYYHIPDKDDDVVF